MNTYRAQHVPYPTQHMEALFPSLAAELQHLHEVLRKREVAITVPMGDTTHARMLETVSEMLARHDPALALFLAHPTQRLWKTLIKAAADASSAVAWLAQNPPAEEMQEYAACCERLQRGIADWRLSVDLKRAEHDLDLAAAETVH